jgi:MYXO-CTERM domain-containing protein
MDFPTASRDAEERVNILEPMMSARLFVFITAVGAACLLDARAAVVPRQEIDRLPPHVAMPLPRELGTAKSAEQALPATPNPLVAYYGGHVISAVKVYDVNWGPNVDATTVATMPQFYPAVVDSAYLDWLEEYDSIGLNGQDGQAGSNQHIRRGTYGSAITITPMNTATSLSETEITTEVAAQIAAKGLPQPDLDKDGNPIAIYMIDFPPNFSFTLLGTTGFCAYHWSVAVNGKQVPFGVHPDLATWLNGQCQGGYTSGQIHSHELMEAITDTETGAIDWGAGSYARPAAWADNGASGGEVGDICVYKGDIKGMVGSWSVQKIWSNAAGACVDQFPVCGGANVYPNCHRCTQFDDGTLCAGMTPVCETNNMSTQFGNCVACVHDTDCSGSTPFCDPTGDTCRACTAADCMGAKPVCEGQNGGNFAGQCVQCDATNKAACTGATPKCDTMLDLCVGCVTSSDCAGSTPICDMKSHACRGCTSNGDCHSPDPACDTSNDAKKGQCVPCMKATDCPSGDSCDPSTHTCMAANDGGPGDGGRDGATGDGGAGDGGDDDGGTGGSGSGSSCGCRAAGDGAWNGGGVAALALGLLAAGRRRRARPGAEPARRESRRPSPARRARF